MLIKYNNYYAYFVTCLFIFSGIFMLPGCHHAHKRTVLPPIHEVPVVTDNTGSHAQQIDTEHTYTKDIEHNKRARSQQEHDVTVKVKPYDQNESIDFFGVNLLAHNYKPLQIEIGNMSTHTYITSAHHIGLPLAPESAIYKLLHYDTTSYTYSGVALSAIFIWPLIPVVLYGSHCMSDYNHRMNEKLHSLSINDKEKITILPGETISRIVFVAGQHNDEHFTVSLFNTDKKELLKFRFS